MFDRKKFGWQVQLLSEEGKRVTREIWNFWDPDRDTTAHDIGIAAAATEAVATQVKQQPVKVTRITKPTLA